MNSHSGEVGPGTNPQQMRDILAQFLMGSCFGGSLHMNAPNCGCAEQWVTYLGQNMVRWARWQRAAAERLREQTG